MKIGYKRGQWLNRLTMHKNLIHYEDSEEPREPKSIHIEANYISVVNILKTKYQGLISTNTITSAISTNTGTTNTNTTDTTI